MKENDSWKTLITDMSRLDFTGTESRKRSTTFYIDSASYCCLDYFMQPEPHQFVSKNLINESYRKIKYLTCSL